MTRFFAMVSGFTQPAFSNLLLIVLEFSG